MAAKDTSGVQSSGVRTVGTNCFINSWYSRTFRVSRPCSSTGLTSLRIGAVWAAGKNVGQILGGEDSWSGGAYVRDGVDQPVRVECGHHRCKFIQWHRERHAHVEWCVAVHSHPPAGWLKAPVGLYIHCHKAILYEPDTVASPAAPMDDDALRCSGSGLDLSRGDLQVLSCCGHPAFGGPLVMSNPAAAARTVSAGWYSPNRWFLRGRDRTPPVAFRTPSAPSPCAGMVDGRGHRILRSRSAQRRAAQTTTPSSASR